MPAGAERLGGLLAGALLAVAAHAAEAPPEAGFLEFLGMLVEDEGEFLDPLDMAGEDWDGRGVDGRAVPPPTDERTATPLEDSEHERHD
jgi:hypothetical protein